MSQSGAICYIKQLLHRALDRWAAEEGNCWLTTNHLADMRYREPLLRAAIRLAINSPLRLNLHKCWSLFNVFKNKQLERRLHEQEILEAFIFSLNWLVGQNIQRIVSIVIIGSSSTGSKNCYVCNFGIKSNHKIEIV